MPTNIHGRFEGELRDGWSNRETEDICVLVKAYKKTHFCLFYIVPDFEQHLNPMLIVFTIYFKKSLVFLNLP